MTLALAGRAVAMLTALLPAGVFYSEYALTDAIYPVLVLGWLLAVHNWLTARSTRGQYAAAAGSALLAGYAYSVHSRGTVMVLSYVVVAALVAWRRLAPRRTVAAAALVVAGRATDFLGGVRVAIESIDSGAAREKLERLIAFAKE